MPTTPGYRTIECMSDGATLRGRHYEPGERPAPVVIIFCERGLAELAFDHRGHGARGGDPRGEINSWVKARGYIDAIDDRVGALVCQVPALGDAIGAPDPDGTRLDAIRRFLATGPMRRPSDAWASTAVVSPEDESPFAVSAVARVVFDRLAGPKELDEVDGGHFGIIEHPSPAFERSSEAQAAWLSNTLGAIRA
jgi:hypothetical protein